MNIAKKRVDEIFAAAEDQVEYIIALYKEVYPRWDDIASVDGYPHCGEDLHRCLMKQAMAFDAAHHVSFPGGAWMNKGFARNRTLKPWQVIPCAVTLL